MLTDHFSTTREGGWGFSEVQRTEQTNAVSYALDKQRRNAAVKRDSLETVCSLFNSENICSSSCACEVTIHSNLIIHMFVFIYPKYINYYDKVNATTMLLLLL